MPTHTETYGGSNSKFFTGNTAISFRALQQNFRGPSTNNVKFSDYIKVTSKNVTNMVVPDSIDNPNVKTSSGAGSNMSAEDYRNTIKEKEITSTGSASTNYDIDALWNDDELSRNIFKKHIIKHTCLASSTGNAAADFQDEAANFSIILENTNSIIRGEGGDGAPAGNGLTGSNGGTALYVANNSTHANTRNIDIICKAGSFIGGGGGGGGSGNKGADNQISCFVQKNNTKDGGRYNRIVNRQRSYRRKRHRSWGFRRRRGYRNRNPERGGCNRNTDNCRGSCDNVSNNRHSTPENNRSGQYWADTRTGSGALNRANCNSSDSRCRWTHRCTYRHNYHIGSYGGNGGAGGRGQGSNRAQANGGSGNNAHNQHCNASGGRTKGGKGSQGGHGGNYGRAGNRRGGNPGAAISGNRYTYVPSGGTVEGNT